MFIDADGNRVENLPTTLGTLLAGENQTFGRMFGGAMCLVSAAKTADALIYTGPCILYGYIVHAATASNAIEIENGLTANAVDPTITIAASTAVGTYLEPVGIYHDTGIYLNFTGTGTVAVAYLPVA